MSGIQAVDQDVRVFRPNQRHQSGWLATWVTMFRNVWRARELVWQLFKRDFLASYKKSFIGFAWIFITPLLGVVSWVFLQRTGLLQPGHTPIPYPAYVLIGTTMFGLFVELFRASTQTLMAGAALVMQVNYPHEAILFQQVGQQLARFTISLALNLVVLAAFHVVPSWGVLLLPLVALPLFLLATALGLVVSMFAVVAVDLSTAATMLVGLLLYACPIIYPPDIDNATIQSLMRWNPLTYLVCSCRDVVISGRLYQPMGYLVCSTIAALLFMVAWRLFYVSEQKLVERIM